jgi:ABC-2 type transport system ATP-binding protein
LNHSSVAPGLALADVSKHFGVVPALRNVSFTVEPGEIFGYLGPNGAGKTTTIRIALGLIRADAGQVRVLGGEAHDPGPRAAVGFLPGELRLWGALTGREVLDHFARYRPGRPPRLRGALLDALALDDVTLRRRIKHLSHGTRQKLGLVIAMQHDPELLLLDEPTLGLDPLVQHAFRAVVQDFAARSRAVLFSSHVLSEVDEVCSRVAIIRAGEIIAVEEVTSLRRRVLRQLRVRFRDVLPDNLSQTPGIERLELRGDDVLLWVRGDVNPLLRRLADATVDELVFPEAQLEDIFLGYYQNGPGA